MSDTTAPTRRDVWVSMLLYPAHTLPTAAAPVLVACGLAVHNGVFSVGPAVMAFVAGWFIQLGGVVTDNYINVTRHADDREHAAFVYALKKGLISMSELRLAIAGCYLAAALVAVRLAYLGGLPVVIIGLVSVVASLAYSTGPLPLGDNGMGDPLFFVFFGLVSVGGAYYVQGAAVLGTPLAVHTVPGLLTGTLLVVSLPMAALMTNILIIDNIPRPRVRPRKAGAHDRGTHRPVVEPRGIRRAPRAGLRGPGVALDRWWIRGGRAAAVPVSPAGRTRHEGSHAPADTRVPHPNDPTGCAGRATVRRPVCNRLGGDEELSGSEMPA